MGKLSNSGMTHIKCKTYSWWETGECGECNGPIKHATSITGNDYVACRYCGYFEFIEGDHYDGQN